MGRTPGVLRGAIPLAVCACVLHSGNSCAQAAPPATELDALVVTATRREESAQGIPFNIAVVGAGDLDRQGITDLGLLTRQVPGVFYLDQGTRSPSLVTARGLHTSSITASEGASGGAVATYLGDIATGADLRLYDLDRVEVLLGPQGTLYGAGSLGGAIRYIPNRPDPLRPSFKLETGAYGRSHSSGLGTTTLAAWNQPLVDGRLALRVASAYFNDPGFTDYTAVVREPGVSDPQPDPGVPGEVDANLRRVADADGEETSSTRIGLAYVVPRFRADLSFTRQQQRVQGRSINHVDAFGTGEHEAAHRFLEPNRRRSELGGLEVQGDLGFATLTSATGLLDVDEHGQRDQTDLYLEFGFGYEEFDRFVAFTRDELRVRGVSQELRLVSPDTAPLRWIAGLYFGRNTLSYAERDYVPGFPEFAGIDRPDALDFIGVGSRRHRERAVFGELGYPLNEQWQATLGARAFDFEIDERNAFDLPLFNGTRDQVFLDYTEARTAGDGVLFKFNTSYRFDRDRVAYLTISEGYRSGGVNVLPACPDPVPPGEVVCALPGELLIRPDSTLNHELGVRDRWFDGRVSLNAAAYYIDWQDVQVQGFSVNGAVPIIVNGSAARSQGVELDARMRLFGRLQVLANYSYNDARLTEDAPGIVQGEDGRAGDRLPGSPRHSGNLVLAYTDLLPNGWNLMADYGIFASGEVYTRVGLRNNGEALGGFALHNASLGVASGAWTARLHGSNLFDRYAATGVRRSRGHILDVGPNDFRVRRYYRDVTDPRTVGLTLGYAFDT